MEVLLNVINPWANPLGIKSCNWFSALNSQEKNSLNIENTTEYHIEGIPPVSVKPEHGLEFAETLRVALRQNPDVILIGEIRDEKTAPLDLDWLYRRPTLFHPRIWICQGIDWSSRRQVYWFKTFHAELSCGTIVRAQKVAFFIIFFFYFVMCSSNVFSQCAIADNECAGSSENNWKSWFEKQTLVGKGLSPLKLAHITIRDNSIPWKIKANRISWHKMIVFSHFCVVTPKWPPKRYQY